VDRSMPIADCRLPIADCRLPIASVETLERNKFVIVLKNLLASNRRWLQTTTVTMMTRAMREKYLMKFPV
jgi:hypothetical protein